MDVYFSTSWPDFNNDTYEDFVFSFETSDYPPWAMTLCGILALFISAVGFAGNMLTILALPYTRKLRNASTWFVVNLAVAEGMFCMTILPMSAAHLFFMTILDAPLFQPTGCRIFVFLRYVNIQAELLSIAAIALNRCILIAKPKKYSEIYSKYKTTCYICAIWTVSTIIMLFPLLEIYGKFTYNKLTKECDFSDDMTQPKFSPRKVFLLIGFFVPCLIIISSYSYIFYKSRRTSMKLILRTRGQMRKELHNENRTHPVIGLKQRELRIARTILVIFIAFLVCCLPVTIVHYNYTGKTPLVLLMLHPLYWMQYCLNIFIYVLMNKQYRDAYINYISKWWPQFREISKSKCRWAEEHHHSSDPESLTSKEMKKISPADSSLLYKKPRHQHRHLRKINLNDK